MEDIIKLKSRGEENNYLKKLRKPDNSESSTYVLKVSTPTVGVTMEGNKHVSIDPSGGPVIKVGVLLEEAQAVVKSIDFTIGYGFTITFE